MRKIWIMALAAVLVVAFAAPSFSAETTFSGSYRIRSVMDDNWQKGSENGFTYPVVGGFVPNGDALYTGYFDQRFRLTITHKRSEFLKAVVSIDLAEDLWGQQKRFRTNNSDRRHGRLHQHGLHRGDHPDRPLQSRHRRDEPLRLWHLERFRDQGQRHHEPDDRLRHQDRPVHRHGQLHQVS